MLQDAVERIESLEVQVRHLAGAAKQAIPCPACGKVKFRRTRQLTVRDANGKTVGKEALYVCIACKHEERDDLPV